MRIAFQSFFFVQVALERAFDRISEASNSFLGQYVRTPLQQGLRDFIGVGETAEHNGGGKELRGEIESIRNELKGLRNDVRELQKTPVS